MTKSDKLVKSVLENTEGVSFAATMKLLRNKDIKVNGARVNKDLKLNRGDLVELYYTPREDSPVTEIYSDDNVIIADKKAGYTSESVFEYLNKKQPLFFIHRLDRNTSGIMVFAKTPTAERELVKGFKNRDFEKIYRTSVFGKPKKDNDVLTAYLIKDAKKSTVRIYDKNVEGASPIKTGYTVIRHDSEKNITTMNVRLYTGKTHQIRAHLAHIGLPVVGDGKYGDNKLNKIVGAKRQDLTAYSLTFHFKPESALYYLDKKTFVEEEK